MSSTDDMSKRQISERPAPLPSVLMLLERGIDALARADAGAVSQLAEEAVFAKRPDTVEEQKWAREKLRALEILVELTGRNLRLLRGINTYGSLSD